MCLPRDSTPVELVCQVWDVLAVALVTHPHLFEIQSNISIELGALTSFGTQPGTNSATVAVVSKADERNLLAEMEVAWCSVRRNRTGSAPQLTAAANLYANLQDVLIHLNLGYMVFFFNGIYNYFHPPQVAMVALESVFELWLASLRAVPSLVCTWFVAMHIIIPGVLAYTLYKILKAWVT